ncbi:MAG: hypothetical protein H0W62_08330 [Chitinophagales bacterium]|nr:hypothetical protein [Chitinophagales bacterium]
MKNVYSLIFIIAFYSEVLSQPWTPLGPIGSPLNSISSGANAHANGTGQLKSFAIYDNNKFYVSSRFGGLFKTINGGVTWSSTAADLLPLSAISDIAIDPGNSDVVYLATGDGNKLMTDLQDPDLNYLGYDPWQPSVGIYKLNTLTGAYQAVGPTIAYCDKKLISRIIISPSDVNVQYAAMSDGLYRTGDAWTTWTKVLPVSGNQFCSSVEFKPGNPSTVYAAFADPSANSNYANIYINTNNGTGSWPSMADAVLNFPLSSTVKLIRLGVSFVNSPQHSGYLYAIMNASQPYLYWYDGTQWNIQYPKTGGRIPIAVNPTDDNKIATADVYFYTAVNHGTASSDWSVLGSPNSNYHADIWGLKYFPNSSTILMATDGGVFKYDGTSFTELNMGINASTIYRFGTSATNKSKIIIGDQDTGTNLWDGTNWTYITHYALVGQDAFGSLIDYAEENNLYAAPNSLVYQKSINGGISWSSIGITSGSARYDNPPIIQDPNSSSTYLVGRSDLWKTTDQWITNTQNSDFPSCFSTGGQPITAIAIAPSNSQVIVAATDFASGTVNSRLFMTSNSGGISCSSWMDITPTLNDPGIQQQKYRITSIVINPNNPNEMWIGYEEYDPNTSHKIMHRYYNDDIAQYVWGDFSTGINSCYNIYSLVYRSGSNNELYVGTDVGVFYRNNSMSQWTQFNLDPVNKLPNVEVRDLEILYCTNKLRAATFGRGVWEADLPALYTPNATATLSSNTTWDKSRTLPTNVVVAAGLTLTVNNAAEINMAKDRYIKIMPGAKMVIDNATITNSCGTMWSGIQVLGDPAKAQSINSSTQMPNYQGMLVMKNNAKIENAYIAVLADEAFYSAPDYAYPNGLGTKGGGILQINQSSFVNNRNGITFFKYPSSAPVINEAVDVSYIENSAFSCTGVNAPYTGQFTNEFISMWDVHGIYI